MNDCPACFSPIANGACTNAFCGFVVPDVVRPSAEREARRRVRARRRASLGGPHFDGGTYDPEQDQARLGQQLDAVRKVMGDKQWRTLSELAKLADAPEASVSARIRDLRKRKFGGHRVDSRRRQGSPGVWEYRLDG